MFTFFKSGKKKINTSIGGRTSMKSAKTHSLEQLIELVRRIRPSSPNQSGKAENNIRLLIKELSAHPEKLAIIRETVLLKFQSCDVSNALAESGLMNSRAFMQEFWHRVKWKFLPKLHSKDDLLYLIEQLFYKKSDHRWVRTVSQDCWIEFFELLDIKLTIKGRKLQQQLADSLRLLSYRLSAAGLAKEIMEHFQDKSREAAPFIHQNILVNEMVRDFEESDPALTYVWNIEHIDKIIVSLLDCEKQIQHMRQHRNEHGTSVEQTFLLLKMGQHIGRMMLLLDLIQNTDTYKTERFLEYFIGLVRNQNLQNSIREFISRNYSLLAYQIAEHKGKKGLNYIAYTKMAYRTLFRKSMQGGIVAGFMSILKVGISYLNVSPFTAGLLYSTNYATGFVVIDQTGSTLATKQPSYTASTVARSLDVKATKGHPNLKNLAITTAAMLRSQVASFAGNILVVFPVAYLLAAAIHQFSGWKVATGEKAVHLLEVNHPFHSPALWYACIAGFLLFFSGLVAGYVENRVLYANIPERMAQHPRLRFVLSKKRLQNWSNFVRRKMGTFVGSVVLGFLLGFAAFIGKMTNLPIDIRHVTLSTGHVAIALYDLHAVMPLSYLLTIVLGLALIGMINLLVSFSLAFMVAVRSRQINIREYKIFALILYHYFKKYPKDFFRPPAIIRTPEEL